MRLSTFARLLATAALVAAPAAARAQFAVYTDLASFLAATSNAGTDGFDDLDVGSLATPFTRTAGAHGYTASSNTTEFYVTGPGADRWLSTNTSTDIVTFGGFAPTVRGVGGFFFGTDIDGMLRPGTDLTLLATDGSGTYSHTLVGATTTSFLGFVSSGPITSLSVQTVLPRNDLAWPTVNGLVLAESAVATPEPSSLALMVSGAAAIVLVARRRRA